MIDSLTYDIRTIIIKPSSSQCNLRCSYCYNRVEHQHRSHSAIMTIETAETIYKLLPALGAKIIKLIWHGGEPLLRGIDFYESVVTFQKRIASTYPNIQIRNSLMTNGTLVNDKWITFFKNNKWHLGLSLDGPFHIHNKYRLDSRNHGTFDIVTRNIKRLKQAGVPIGLIAVITSNTIMKSTPKEIYQFLSSFSHNFEISPCWEAPQNYILPDYVIKPDAFLEFIKSIFNIWWEEDNPKIKIRLLDSLVRGVIGEKSLYCSFNGTCSQFLSIDADGSVYPCGKFAGIPEFFLGNIHEDTISTILTSNTYMSYLETSKRIPDRCKICEWFQVCHNGCTYERYIGNGNFIIDSPFCDTWKKAFEYVRYETQKILNQIDI